MKYHIAPYMYLPSIMATVFGGVLILALVLGPLLVKGEAAPTCSTTVTTKTGAAITAAVTGATAGSTVCLSSGTYSGTAALENISKTSDVTIITASGQNDATISIRIYGSKHLKFQNLIFSSVDLENADTKNITFTNSTFNGQLSMNLNGNSNAAILVEGSTFNPWSAGPSDPEGRLHIAQPGSLGSQPVGVTINANTFVGPGCSDGIQVGSYGVIVTNNVFTGIKQGSCSAHVDSIQLYGQSHTTITGNYFKDFTTALMAPDGGDGGVISNNVFDSSAGSTNAIQMGSFKNSTFSHNTVWSTEVHIDHKTDPAEPNSTGNTFKDNVMIDNDYTIDAGNTITHNMYLPVKHTTIRPMQVLCQVRPYLLVAHTLQHLPDGLWRRDHPVSY